MKYVVQIPQDKSQLKFIEEWLEAMYSDHSLELVAVDNGLYILRPAAIAEIFLSDEAGTSGAFKFALTQPVSIKASGESGTVIARVEYSYADPMYEIRFVNKDGKAEEAWWKEEALVVESDIIDQTETGND